MGIRLRKIAVAAALLAGIGGIAWVASGEGSPVLPEQYALGELQGRIAIYRDYNGDQSTMRICGMECRTVNNLSHIKTAKLHPYYMDVGQQAQSLQLQFDAAPAQRPYVERIKPAAILEPGLYEDNHPGIQYSGSWLVQEREGPTQNRVHTAAEAESRAEFTFRGTGLELGIVRYDDRHIGELCVDAVCRDINLFSYTLNWQHPYAVFGLAEGEHKVSYLLKSGKVIDIDWLRIFGGPPVLTKGEYPADLRIGQFTTGWNLRADQQGVISPRGPASMALRFHGQSVMLTFEKSNDSGDTEICLDGDCQTYSLYAYSPQTSTVTVSTDSAGEHSLTLDKRYGRFIKLKSVRIE